MMMKDTALRLLGPCPRREFRPWLRGKERELRELENRVHRLEVQLHQARRSDSGSEHSLLSERRSASRELHKQKRRWEAQGQYCRPTQQLLCLLASLPPVGSP